MHFSDPKLLDKYQKKSNNSHSYSYHIISSFNLTRLQSTRIFHQCLMINIRRNRSKLLYRHIVSHEQFITFNLYC